MPQVGNKKDMYTNYLKIYKKALLNIDKIIAMILSIIATIFIITTFSKGHYYGLHLPIVILFPSIVYFLFRDNNSSNENLPEISESNRLLVITHIFFSISVTLLLWFSWSNLYCRPPLYFALILIAAASIIINIFCLNETKNFNVVVVLIKIITLSYIIYAGIYYQFEGIYGTDPWLHNSWIQETINIGHLTENSVFVGSYYLFPIFHLSGAITSIITSLSISSSIFASSGFLMAMSGIFVFIICRTTINAKAGLLTALIVPLTANNIEKATELIPMSLGYIFLLSIVCLIFYSTRKRFEKILLMIFLSGALILTHTIASFAMLLFLIAIFGAIKLYDAIMKTSTSNKMFSHTLILFFVVTMTTRWMQNPPKHASFMDIRISHLVEALQLDAQFVLEMPQTISDIPYHVAMFDLAGYLFLLAFATIGALSFLHFQKLTPNRIALAFVAGVIFISIYAFDLLNLNSILPYRWYLFLYVPLSILAVIGIIWVSNLIKNKTGKLAFVMLVILAIIFSMTTNSLANKDNPPFFQNAVRFGYTQSEFAAIDTLSNINPGRFVTDIYFSIIFEYVLTYDKYNKMMQSNNNIFIQRNYYLNHPEWNENYKVRIVSGNQHTTIAEKTFILNFAKKEYMIDDKSMIYNNGNVKTYII